MKLLSSGIKCLIGPEHFNMIIDICLLKNSLQYMYIITRSMLNILTQTKVIFKGFIAMYKLSITFLNCFVLLNKGRSRDTTHNNFALGSK